MGGSDLPKNGKAGGLRTFEKLPGDGKAGGDLKWEVEITVEVRQEDKLLESGSRETEFPVGKWEHFLFYVLPFSAKVGPCALRLVVEGHCIAQKDVEIVSENNAAVPLPRLPECERLAM